MSIFTNLDINQINLPSFSINYPYPWVKVWDPSIGTVYYENLHTGMRSIHCPRSDGTPWIPPGFDTSDKLYGLNKPTLIRTTSC